MPSSGKGAGACAFSFRVGPPRSFSVNVGGMCGALLTNAYIMHLRISSPISPGQSRSCDLFSNKLRD
jgi:hypothetical protein